MIESQMPLQEAGRATEVEELLHKLIGGHSQAMSSLLQVLDAVPNHTVFIPVDKLIKWALHRVMSREEPRPTANWQKRMNGLPSKNSIPFSITRSKSKRLLESRREEDWSSRSLIDKFLRKKLDLRQKKKREECTNRLLKSMSSCLVNVRLRKTLQSGTRLCKRRKAVIDSWRRRKLGNVRKRKKLSNLKLSWCKDWERKCKWNRLCKLRREGKRKSISKKCYRRMKATKSRLRETRWLSRGPISKPRPSTQSC